MKVGQILINAGLIDEQQLEIALAEQAKTGSELDVILAGLSITTDDAVSRVLAEQSDVAHIDVDDADIDPKAVALGESIASERNVLSLGIERLGAPGRDIEPHRHHRDRRAAARDRALRASARGGTSTAAARPRPHLWRASQLGNWDATRTRPRGSHPGLNARETVMR